MGQVRRLLQLEKPSMYSAHDVGIGQRDEEVLNDLDVKMAYHGSCTRLWVFGFVFDDVFEVYDFDPELICLVVNFLYEACQMSILSSMSGYNALSRYFVCTFASMFPSNVRLCDSTSSFSSFGRRSQAWNVVGNVACASG
jgi:hypothetical protein